jgi:hypothetical protein
VLRPHVHDVEVVLVAVQLLEAGLDGLRAGAVPAPRVAHQHQHALLAAARCAATPRPVEWPQLRSTRYSPAAMLQSTTEPVWADCLVGASCSVRTCRLMEHDWMRTGITALLPVAAQVVVAAGV